MNWIWKFGCFCLLMMTLAFSPVLAQTQTVLQQVPADADRVFVFSSLQKLSDDLIELGNLTGMQHLVPPNPLLMMQSESGLMIGVDANAPAVITLDGKIPTNPAADDSVMSMLLPMVGKDEFMKNFETLEVTQHQDGIQSANLKGEVIYFKPVSEKYVLMSNKIEQLTRYQKPAADHWINQQGKISIKQLAKSDLMILYSPDALKKDVPSKSPVPLPMPMPLKMDDAMAEVQSAAASFALTKQGIDLGFTMQFKPDSKWHAFFANAPQDKLTRFEMMPDRTWVMASEVMLKHLDLEKFSENITASLPEEQKPDAQTKALFTALSSYQKLEQMLVADAQGQWKVINALKHPGYTREMFTQFEQSLADAQKQLADNPDVPVVFENKTDALQVPGALGTHTLTIKSEDEMINQGLMRNAGTDALTVYFGYNDKGVVSVLGDEDLFKRSVAALAADELPGELHALENSVKDLRVALPEDCFAAGYLNLSQTIRYVQTMMLKYPETAAYAMMLSMIQLPDDMPPLVGTIANVDGGVRFGLFLPSKTVTITSQTVMRLMVMMQQMMGPQQQQQMQLQ